MKRAGYRLIVIGSILLGLGVAAVTAADMAALQPLLDRMPAKNSQQEQELFAALLTQGPEGVEAVCGLLAPPGTGDDTKIRYALHGLAVFATRPGAEAQRLIVAGGLVKALAAHANPEAKTFIMNQLQVVGRDEAVAALAGFLADESLCEPAAQALATIKTEAATAALAKALPTVAGANRITLIRALGVLRAKEAATTIRPYAGDANRELRLTAAWALANLGDEAAGAAIARAMSAAEGYERGQMTASYLLLAERLAQQGNKTRAMAICRELVADAKATNNVSCAALSLLVEVAGADGLKDLIRATGSENFYLQSQAVTLAGAVSGPQATRQWVTLLDKVPAPVRAKIVAMLGQRGDASALGAVQARLNDDNQSVRLAAIVAVARLGGAPAGDSLMAVLSQREEAEELAAAANALLQFKNQAVSRKAVAALDTLKPPARIAVIDALGFWPAPGSVDTLLARIADADAAVRLAAWRALALLAQPDDFARLVEAMTHVEATGEQTAARQAALAAASRMDNPGRLIPVLLAPLATAGDKPAALLIETLGQMGGEPALAALVEQSRGAKPAIRDAAVRALAKWSDPAALPHLIAIIGNSDTLSGKVLACRGCIDLVAGSDWPADRKVQTYAELMPLAPRPDEKMAILAQLKELKCVEALKLADSYLDDQALGADAAQTAAAIALPTDKGDDGLGGPDAEQTLSRVLERTTDAKQKESIQAYLNRIGLREPPAGFTALFNGKDLTGWHGLLFGPNDNPIKRAALTPEQLTAEQARADEDMRLHWTANDGVLYFDGAGHSLATVKTYRDFEMWVDWKIQPDGDSGIYLRGSPQVQIWDPKNSGFGSGGLYNNQKHPSKPLVTADRPTGQWNTFFIRMTGERVTVDLNGQRVVDDVIMENYWDRARPIFDEEQIELQCHGNPVAFRNIFLRELPAAAEWKTLFNGTDLTGWVGDTAGYKVEEGAIVCRPGGNLYTADEYADFHLKFEFKLTPGANNGLGIRAPLSGDAAYGGMELQILDDSAEKYASLQPYQYHGSIYGVEPVKRGFQKPVGEWNTQEVIAQGNRIKVILNGTTVLDADITGAIEKGTRDGHEHPGLKNKTGHIGFLGHGDVVFFRNLSVKPL